MHQVQKDRGGRALQKGNTTQMQRLKDDHCVGTWGVTGVAGAKGKWQRTAGTS